MSIKDLRKVEFICDLCGFDEEVVVNTGIPKDWFSMIVKRLNNHPFFPIEICNKAVHICPNCDKRLRDHYTGRKENNGC